jgi:hemolysin activation/secretion protein
MNVSALHLLVFVGLGTLPALSLLGRPFGSEIAAVSEEKLFPRRYEEKESFRLKQILLIEEPVQTPQENVEIQLASVPGSREDLKKALDPFIGAPLNPELIRSIKKAIYDYYSAHNQPIVLLKVPEQDISQGILKLLIAPSRLGTVRAVGNKYFKSKTLENFISLKPGDPINTAQLSDDLIWMNRNTFRQTDLIFTPGKAHGTTDIELVTQDRRPWRFFAGGDNTGILDNDPYRITTGFNIGNLFGSQMFTYQFSSAPNYRRFYSHTGYYTIPLPWKHMLIFYGGYSHVRVPLPSSLHTTGSCSQVSGRYEIPLSAPFRVAHEFTFGYDYKRLNNNLVFTDIPVTNQTAQITQCMVGYNLGFKGDIFKTSFTVELFGSPFTWISDQSKSDYESLRPEAKPQYFYTRGTFAPIILLPKEFTIQAIFRGQWSTANLLISEQFGIGGYNTVRGYLERIRNGDNAFLATLEVRSPALSSPTWMIGKKFKDSWQFLAFFDYGLVRNHQNTTTLTDKGYLASVGPGFRYYFSSYLTARLDWGFQLKRVSGDSNFNRGHFSLEVSY